MKTSRLLILLSIFSLMLALTPARAAEPAPMQLTPELQALLADLLKQSQADADPAPAPAPEAAPAPAVTAAPSAPVKPPLGSNSSLRTGSLSSSGLQGASLTPSGSVGGRGQTGFPRLSKEEWRALFPLAQDRR